MKHSSCPDWDISIPRNTATLIIDTARTGRIPVHPLPRDRAGRLPPHRSQADLIISRKEITSIYNRLMLALYLKHTGSTCGDDRDLFLAYIVHGKTLEEVIARAITFTRHCTPRGWRLSLDADGANVVFSMDSNLQASTAQDLLHLFSIGGFYRLFSWLIGESLCASRVFIAAKQLHDQAVLSEIFDCPAQFQTSVTSITFPGEMLHRPVIRTCRELVELVSVSPLELMPQVRPGTLSAQLEMLFRKCLAMGVPIPSISELADRLCQSGPTLRRNLAREQVSFQCLVDKCRRERAVELLGQPHMTIDEISYSLGYSAPSGFTRAFKEWTGHTPSSYRQHLLEQVTTSDLVTNAS